MLMYLQSRGMGWCRWQAGIMTWRIVAQTLRVVCCCPAVVLAVDHPPGAPLGPHSPNHGAPNHEAHSSDKTGRTPSMPHVSGSVPA